MDRSWLRVVKSFKEHGWTRPGERERDKLLIMAGKRSFVWTYLEEDGHLRRYAHDSCSSTQGCHVGRKKKEDKRGSNNQEASGFLPSDPSPRQTRGFCYQIPYHDGLEGFCHRIPHYGPYADGLPWACYLRPAAFSQTYSDRKSTL